MKYVLPQRTNRRSIFLSQSISTFKIEMTSEVENPAKDNSNNVEKLGDEIQTLNLEKQFTSVEDINSQYEELLKEVAKLTAAKDTETKPFASKYSAITKLVCIY